MVRSAAEDIEPVRILYQEAIARDRGAQARARLYTTSVCDDSSLPDPSRSRPHAGRYAQSRAVRVTTNRMLADMGGVGYGRPMQADEAGTLAILKQRRKDTREPTVARHRGCVVKLMGDGALNEASDGAAVPGIGRRFR